MMEREVRHVRRWHGREFKLEAVRLVREGGASAAQIAAIWGLSHLLHKWTKEFEVDPEHSFLAGEDEAGAARDRAARREVQKLKAERDILKKAAAYFAKEST